MSAHAKYEQWNLCWYWNWKPINGSKFGNDVSILTPPHPSACTDCGDRRGEEIPKHTQHGLWILMKTSENNFFKDLLLAWSCFWSCSRPIIYLILVNILTSEFMHKNYAAYWNLFVDNNLNSSLYYIVFNILCTSMAPPQNEQLGIFFWFHFPFVCHWSSQGSCW